MPHHLPSLPALPEAFTDAHGSRREKKTFASGLSQGSPNRWQPGRFDRFPVLLVRPGSKMIGNRSLTGPKKPGQTEPSGVPAGLPGFPVGFFEPCKSDRVRFGEPWS
jgi:hypothetical protein